ncbi:uncharacterized protein CDAR_393221 [Caerostris darwini]|uniref:Apple domain-containing protein n=1 Tax=Caerostris darwini TaxID=1538125 RepID=A0AAV4V0Y7_9ARAC|nr:uncharacterized protein CDAR_393221 [Caerostris darwini]
MIRISAFEVSMTQFYFWFENKVHVNWVLGSFDDSHMVTCLQKCRNDTDCSGMALGPLREDSDKFQRTCITLSDVEESDCDDNDDCEREKFQVFQFLKPMKPTTTTKLLTTSTKYPITTTEISTTTTRATTLSTTTEAQTTTSEILTSTTEASSTTTTRNTPTATTVSETSSTAASTSTTTKNTPTTTTESETTITTAASTSTTTATSTSTTARNTPTATTERETTTGASTSTTTTTAASNYTTTRNTPTTTTEGGTTTTETISSTTDAGTSTLSTTTQSSECSDADDNPQAANCKVAERQKQKCGGVEASIICSEPRDQSFVFGLVSSVPLFTDVRMQVRCKNQFSQAVFKMETKKDTYNPFAGTMGCNPDETIIGIDVCFQGELKYVSVECCPIQPGFTIDNSTVMAGNSKQDPVRATCPEEKSMITLRLNKDSNGDINVSIGCAKIIKK